MCEIPIESMKRMRLKEGDAVVLKVQSVLSQKQIALLRESMEASFVGLQKHPIIILDEGIDIEILSQEGFREGTEEIIPDFGTIGKTIIDTPRIF